MIKPMMVFLLAVILSIQVGIGQAETRGDIPDHPHRYPYTKMLGDDYHLRLIVDRDKGRIQLVFEDVSEKAVRIMPLKTIDAEVIFEGGKRREIQFKAVKKHDQWTHGDAHPVFRLVNRRAGLYVYGADWIREAVDFDLIVSFPFQGEDYKFVFDYSTGGHMFREHMGR